MEKFITQKLNENLVITIYGEENSTFNLNLEKENSESLKKFGKEVSLVKVLGIQSKGVCIRLDKPKYLILPGIGESADGCGFEGSETTKMWKVEKDFNTLGIEFNSMSMDELVQNQVIGGLSLSVKLKDSRYNNGVYKGTVQVKADFVLMRITENIPINVTIYPGGSIEVFNGYLGMFHVSIKLNLETINKACARVTISYSGLSANEQVCTTF